MIHRSPLVMRLLRNEYGLKSAKPDLEAVFSLALNGTQPTA